MYWTEEKKILATREADSLDSFFNMAHVRHANIHSLHQFLLGIRFNFLRPISLHTLLHFPHISRIKSDFLENRFQVLQEQQLCMTEMGFAKNASTHGLLLLCKITGILLLTQHKDTTFTLNQCNSILLVYDTRCTIVELRYNTHTASHCDHAGRKFEYEVGRSSRSTWL